MTNFPSSKHNLDYDSTLYKCQSIKVRSNLCHEGVSGTLKLAPMWSESLH
jgi:hypothetical protein